MIVMENWWFGMKLMKVESMTFQLEHTQIAGLGQVLGYVSYPKKDSSGFSLELTTLVEVVLNWPTIVY